MEGKRFDVAIVGAGVIGCSIAYELARTRCSVVVIEEQEDVCAGTSKANSAIVHAGFDAEPGSLMATLNVEGNRLMYPLCAELEVGVFNIGALVVCTDESTRPQLEALLQRGIENGVEGLRIVERDELREMEPHISDAAVAALYAPTSGIVDVFGLTQAFAENAVANGVEFMFNSPVTAIEKLPQGGFALDTPECRIEASCVVNAAGVFADVIHGYVCPSKLEIIPRKGEYYLLDKTAGAYVSRTIFALPTAMGKGVLISPTVHGNLLVGPTSEDIEDKRGTDTTAEGLASAAEKCAITVRDVPLREVITSFAGLRAHRPEHDFLIQEDPDTPGFVDVAGIESPGLSAAPAIGRYVRGIVTGILGLADKDEDEVVRGRRGIVNLYAISADEWGELAAEDPAYGRIICRCCQVSEGQIVDAISRNPGARSLDGVKRRTGAGMGRCQGGFCSHRVMDIISRELDDIDFDQVTKRGKGSELIVGKPKELEGGDAS